MRQLKQVINQMLRPIQNRILMSITRAVIEMAKDEQGMQLVKASLFAGEHRDNIERFQNFGFTSVPPKGSEAVALAMGGNRDHLIIVVADDRRVRLKNLEEGEAAVYTSDGTKIHLKKNGVVDVVAATKVNITCPNVEMSGNLKVNGTILAVGNITSNANVIGGGTDLAAVKAAFNPHTHSDPQGGSTGGPSSTL